ncbi:hypothetical protein AQUCO_02000275v1 [Aquilegia coerulea]|uniref:Uncharacterized protein n=1 Tax=Aquilegia coerulea TaxID=218851 RepID=A0A2G5DGR4_AQUCA|nr:hypothetical protein AQUCO_02000275v1 [Aquilegia coerulea]
MNGPLEILGLQLALQELLCSVAFLVNKSCTVQPFILAFTSRKPSFISFLLNCKEHQNFSLLFPKTLVQIVHRW